MPAFFERRKIRDTRMKSEYKNGLSDGDSR